MGFLFFSKTDKKREPRFFDAISTSAAEDTSASTEQDRDSAGMPIPPSISSRTMRFIKPKESLDELLERLMRNAENSDGLARNNYLEQMLHFLKRNLSLINRVPNKFHSNPLELTLILGDLKMAQELIALKGYVRPENRNLLKKVEPLLQINQPKTLTFSR